MMPAGGNLPVLSTMSAIASLSVHAIRARIERFDERHVAGFLSGGPTQPQGASMKRLKCLSSFFFLVIVGCVEQLAGPDPGASMGEASPSLTARADISAGALLVQLQLPPTPLQGDYTLRVAGILNGFDEAGEAGGSASLSIEGDPSPRFHYVFTEGSVRCDGGLPVANLSGEGHTTNNSGGAQSNTRLFKHDYSFTIPSAAPSPRGTTVQLTLSAGEPEELVGETISLNFEHVYFSPAICDPN
jgi:hypothetical protein